MYSLRVVLVTVAARHSNRFAAVTHTRDTSPRHTSHHTWRHSLSNYCSATLNESVIASEPPEAYRLTVKVNNIGSLLLVYDVTSSELYMNEIHIPTLIEIPQWIISKGNHQNLLLQSELRKRWPYYRIIYPRTTLFINRPRADCVDETSLTIADIYKSILLQ